MSNYLNEKYMSVSIQIIYKCIYLDVEGDTQYMYTFTCRQYTPYFLSDHQN